MTEIHEEMPAECSFDRAPDYLTEYFGSLGAVQGSGATLPLRLNLPIASIARDVLATLKPTPGYSLYENWSVTWAPKNPGPYPTFNGRLDIRPDGPGRCRLVLSGNYEPPGGTAGKLFDATLGKRIASSTMHELLTTLKGVLESAYQLQHD
jgi:hypothetical protein